MAWTQSVRRNKQRRLWLISYFSAEVVCCHLHLLSTTHKHTLTGEVVNSVPHHVCRLGRAVESEVLGHRLLLLGGLTHLLQGHTKD